jgi:pyruvate/2-oxoglutarate dehydrogenase complex dihydrolipoamide dehydrogenase (E3) component
LGDHFVDAQTLRSGDRELSADRILIAAGTRTAVPRVPGIEEVDWIDHVTARELEEIPESLLVVGGGPVGLEFAQIFARFGSRVTIVNRDKQIAARADTEAATELHAALEAEGIEIVLESAVESFAGEGDTTVATLTGGREVRVSRVLLSSGRVPNTEELAPERAGVETDRGYIVVDDHQRTTAKGSGRDRDRASAPPAAQYQARIAIEDMFGDGRRHADYSVMPTAISPTPVRRRRSTERRRAPRHDAIGKHPPQPDARSTRA